jgi:hypothetical protein
VVLALAAKLRQGWRVAFADLKNDFVFRRIFAAHPEILRRLLNDLLERTGERTIETIEYLPSEQLPLVLGAKLSILDVRCKDRTGTTFVVEMQLIHVPGFINRVVYNACKAYVGQLGTGEKYTRLTDVVAISICDFELWPAARQTAQGLPPVPMLSRWNMTERHSGNHGLLQVQYAFLELPKLPAAKPQTEGADLWAWLFVHAPELADVPADWPAGPFRQALELANQATFSQTELDAYRKVFDEIQQVRDLAEAKWAEGEAKGKAEGLAEGKAAGLAEGEVKAKRETLFRLLLRAGLAVTDDDRARIQACTDPATLDRWLDKVLGARSTNDVLAG